MPLLTLTARGVGMGGTDSGSVVTVVSGQLPLTGVGR